MIIDIKVKVEPVDESESTVAAEEVVEPLPKYFCLTSTSEQIVKKMETFEGGILNKDSTTDISTSTTTDETSETTGNLAQELIGKHVEFLGNLKKATVGPFVHAVAQLAHRSTILAHKIWVHLFPLLWDFLEEKQQAVLTGELSPFLASGSHLAQVEGYHSAINTLVEGRTFK